MVVCHSKRSVTLAPLPCLNKLKTARSGSNCERKGVDEEVAGQVGVSCNSSMRWRRGRLLAPIRAPALLLLFLLITRLSTVMQRPILLLQLQAHPAASSAGARSAVAANRCCSHG